MGTCKGFCSAFPKTRITKLYYINGNVFCRACDTHFFKFFDGRYCPCCKSPVRTKPRKQKGKDRVMVLMTAMVSR